MSPRNVLIVYLKELREITRDRRSLVFMVVVPIVGIPLLLTALGGLTAGAVRKIRAEESKVVVLGGERSPRVLEAIREAEKIEVVATGDLPPLPDEAGTREAPPEVDDPEAARLIPWLDAKSLHAIVVVPEGFDAAVEAGGKAGIRVFYDQAEDRSSLAYRQRIAPALQTLREAIVGERLESRGLPKELVSPFETEATGVAPAEKEAGKIAGMILPYMLVLLSFAGALFPAFDLGAGEKERGTLETLLVSPAARTELVFGKFLVILTASVISTVLSLVSLGWAMAGMAGIAGAGMLGSLRFSAAAVGVCLVMILPLAAVFAAVLLSISIFARNYREAQALAGPLNIAIILPAFVSVLPGIALNWKLALVPIVNVSLALKDAFQGIYDPLLLGLIFLSTGALAALSIVFAAGWFSRESVLFRS